MCGMTVRPMSPSDEPQKTVNDVRSLVGGALRAGICRMEDEGRRVRPRQGQPFRACLAFRVSQPGLLLRLARGILGGVCSEQGAKRIAQRLAGSEEWKVWGAQVGGSSSLLLFVCDGRVFACLAWIRGLVGAVGEVFLKR